MGIRQLFHRLVNAGTSDQEEAQGRTTRIVNTFSIITTTLCLLFGTFIYLGTGKEELFIPAYIEAVLFMGVLLLNATNKPVLASISFIAINNIAIVYFSAVIGMLTEAVHLLSLFLLGASLMIFSTRALRMASIAVAAWSVIACEINHYYGLLMPIAMGHREQFIIRWVTLPAILLLDIATICLYVGKLKMVKRQRREKAGFETGQEMQHPANVNYGMRQEDWHQDEQ
jgi:hypothetical protein